MVSLRTFDRSAVRRSKDGRILSPNALRYGGRGIAIACTVAACTSSTVTIEPIIDLPDNASASAFPLGQLMLEVAHEGSVNDIQSATLMPGQGTLEVESVPFADDLVVHLTGTEGTISAYGRTCTFAATATDVPSPHLLFSESAKFADLSYPPEGTPLLRMDGTGITYHDGTGLLIGGVDPNDSSFVSAIEQLDASGFTLQPVDGGTLSARTGTVVAELGAPTPELVVIGGFDLATNATATYIETIALENASDRRVQRIPDNLGVVTREQASATTLGTDNAPIVVIGGLGSTGVPSSAVSLIEAKLDMTTEYPVTLDSPGASLATARYGHTATLLGTGVGALVLVAGGADQSKAAIAAAELYKPLSNMVSTSFAQKMQYPRVHHHAALLPDNSVLFIGGFTDATDQVPVTEVERFTLDGGFNDAGNTCGADSDCPSNRCGLGTPRQCVVDLGASPIPGAPTFGLVGVAVTPLPDGCLLMTGGSPTPGTAPVATAYKLCVDLTLPGQDFIYSLPTSPMTVARAFHQTTLLCDGTVMVTGGTTGDTTAPAEIERYNPNSSGRR